MRTAAEIANESFELFGQSYKDCIIKEIIADIIYSARKEAIEECAIVARSKTMFFSDEQQKGKCPAMVNCAVDKERILSLINELK